MLTGALIRLISEIVSASKVRLDEPMSRHTTFRIGGKADLFAEPSNINQIEALIKLLKQMKLPYFILGNGSNLLVGDKGIRGVVIKLGNQFSQGEVADTSILAHAGIKLSRLASMAANEGLTGLEFAAGIPGTFGGALYMNAGAYGGEMKQIVREVTYLDGDGTCRTISGEECDFGYRKSIFAQTDGCVILKSVIDLQKGDEAQIKAYMEDLAERRISKQPLNMPSAGSTFKRPEGAFAGKLIQDAGLMGFSVGGAAVSEKHAGFIVNTGGATAADVRELICKVQEKVKESSGFELQPEIKFVGEF